MVRGIVAAMVIAFSSASAGYSGAAAPREAGPGPEGPAGSPRQEREAYRANRDSIRDWRSAYLQSMEQRIRAIDRMLDRAVKDSLAKYRADSLPYRRLLEKARTDRDHVDNIMDDLAAVRGEIPSRPWEIAQSDLEITVAALERAFLAADSVRRADEETERRSRRERRSEGG